MRIIAIDTGYDRVGIAIIEKEDKQKEILLFSECFFTDKKDAHETRLFSITKEVKSICDKFKPEKLAIEGLFFSVNKKTALLVAEARGVIINTVTEIGLPVYEFNPNTIKMAVTGYGRSTKKEIIKMVPLLIDTSLKKEKPQDDEYDAIAVGLTFFAIKTYPQ